MKAQPPRVDQRRTAQFVAELEERARTWIPGWAFADVEGDFGYALLKIAARFDSEVTERLDRAGEKMQKGFLDWLAVRGEAARPARMPVVFKLADAARQAVLASAPVRLQADAAGTPVVFETEKDVRVVPGRLDVVVGVDADQDAFYLPPPGLSDLKPLEPLPTQWQLKTFAAAGANKLQLDPEAGLVAEMIIEAGGRQYRITSVDNGIVTIDPRLDGELQEKTVVRKVTTFTPFDGITRNRQEHALYLGHMDLLNIEATATIDIIGASALQTGIKWQYWGKVEGSDEVGWQTLKVLPAVPQKPGALVLEKPKGGVEPTKIAEINSRWIRAYNTKVDGADALLRVDTLQIEINCTPTFPGCPNGGQNLPQPAAEAMANTTPLVLDDVFFPLGKEPRQFDAFYLGSQEAFSKKGAEVQLCFEIADPSFAALSTVRVGAFANTVLAGVAQDRALHLFRFDPTGRIEKFLQREPLQPPLPGFNGIASTTDRVALDAKPPWRLPVWNAGQDFLIGATAGGQVWVWHEKDGDQSNSGWLSLGEIPPSVPPATLPVDGLVHLADAVAPQLAVLREGKLFLRDFSNNAQFTPVATKVGTNVIVLRSIVPILNETASGELVTSTTLGMIGVANDGKLYRVPLNGQCVALPPVNVDVDVRPIAVQRNAGPRIVVVAHQNKRDFISSHSVHNERTVQLEAGARILGFDAVISGGELNFLASVQLDGGGYLASWLPQTGPAIPIHVFRAQIPAEVGQPGGVPAEISKHVVIPGTRADLVIAAFDLAQRLKLQADVKAGIVVPASTPTFQQNDMVTIDTGPPPFARRSITESGTTKDNEVFYPIDQPFNAGVTGALYGFHSTGPSLTGDLDDATATLTLDQNDQGTVEGALLLSENLIHRVGPINVVAGDRVATLNPPPASAVVGAKYWNSVPMNGRIAPYMRLTAANNNWDAALLDNASLVFPAASLANQAKKGKAFSVSGNRPILVVLSTDFSAAPVPGVGAQFVLDAVVGSWSRMLGDSSANPELSWEYWNGKGWWGLDVTLDETGHLKSTGALQFDVPDDIASSDWAGKTNFWIRARLIGGDYGKEKVTVTIKPLPSPPNPANSTEQTVDRSTEGIRPPSVINLTISYRVCDPVLPTYVLAQDSGSILNQSDANRTGGAIVEAFVPLSLMLGRSSGGAISTQPTTECPPQCECQKHSSTTANPTAAPTLTPAASATPATGRSLFIGLDAIVSEAPVNVLLLVDAEHDHTAFAPMTIEALVAGNFKPIVADDATRAVGESGMLSMSFAVPPTLSGLFGRPRTWLRLLPKATAAEWTPSLRGAYLNAVFASATETLTRELLGSSDGSPNLTLRLARPPVLRNTLELRVREPLGEEERDALLKIDANLVLSKVEGLDGDWVLWRKVIDPDDEGPTGRVYALDEEKGEVRFGDGIHGRIPPIGRDAIVAFRYSRTEVGSGASSTVPGNLITARTTLNLVSPVESVEAVFAADQAAGGAPPESDERVLRFGFARLRHRGRAVTANDIEDLALQSSPDFAQARAVVKRGYIRLVVVMKGKNPTPNAAQVRELQRLLLDSAPVSLRAPDSLRIEGPGIRKLRIALVLQVETLDFAGQVSKWVKDQLATFFDSTIGGIDKDGWALGLNPTEDDIAFVLINAPHLDGIADVKLFESLGGGVERRWPETVKPTDIVMLDDDPVRIQFETAEVMA